MLMSQGEKKSHLFLTHPKAHSCHPNNNGQTNKGKSLLGSVFNQSWMWNDSIQKWRPRENRVIMLNQMREGDGNRETWLDKRGVVTSRNKLGRTLWNPLGFFSPPLCVAVHSLGWGKISLEWDSYFGERWVKECLSERHYRTIVQPILVLETAWWGWLLLTPYSGEMKYTVPGEHVPVGDLWGISPSQSCALLLEY